MKGQMNGNDDMNQLEELRKEMSANQAEIKYLEDQLNKKDDENIRLKAEN